MIVDGYASAAHYASHCRPVFDALPAGVRGRFYAPRARDPWGVPLPPRFPAGHVMLVASYVDSVKVRPLCAGYVLVSHGADQSYSGDPRTASNPSYAGGDGHERCILFLTPSEDSAARWRARYPDTPAVAVGCILVDALHARLA